MAVRREGPLLGLALEQSGDGLRVVQNWWGQIQDAPWSPALRAGVEVGDVIVSIDGKVVTDGPSLRTALVGAAGAVQVVVRRDGVEVPIVVRPIPYAVECYKVWLAADRDFWADDPPPGAQPVYCPPVLPEPSPPTR